MSRSSTRETSPGKLLEKQEFTIKMLGKIQADKNAMVNSLKKAGYETITKVAHASPDKLVEAAGLNITMAEKLISAAREIHGN